MKNRYALLTKTILVNYVVTLWLLLPQNMAFADSHKNHSLTSQQLTTIMESHYINTPKKSASSPAGIWQLMPSTAQKLGLVIKGQRDDRLDIKLSTEAVARYFKILHAQFNDWNSILVAYNIGDGATKKLINSVGSKDKWVIARAKQPQNQLTPFLAVFGADVIVIHNTDLLGHDSTR